MLSLKHSKGTHQVSESWQENTMREARTRKTLWTGVLFNTALLGVLLALIVISPELAVAQCSTSEFATICHRPGQTTERTLHIPLEEWSAHLSHGDREGSCIGGGVCEVGYSVCAGECYSDEADARAVCGEAYLACIGAGDEYESCREQGQACSDAAGGIRTDCIVQCEASFCS